MSDEIHVHIDIDGSRYEAARYAFRVLLAACETSVVFHRARPSPLAPDAVLITYTQSRIEAAHGRHLIIYASRRLWEHYGREASLPTPRLPRIPLTALGIPANPRLEDPLVLAYDSEIAPPRADRRLASSGPGLSITTGADVIASAFFWITHYEETLIPERDELGRIPQERLRVIQERLNRRPLVDEYSELLLGWLGMLGVRVESRRPPFRVMLTHDVDAGIGVGGFWEHAENGLRTAYRETVRQRRPRTALMGLAQWALRGLGLREEAALFRDITQLDGDYGFPSFFFLMANGTHPQDASYDISSEATGRVIRTIRDKGGHVGLHVGLNTHTKPAQLRSEWDHLRQADPEAQPVARTHYLAFFPPFTWRQLLELGFIADSSLGFSHHIGFRSATCHAFRPFDVERLEVLPIWEVPMTVMDKNLFYHGDECAYKDADDAARVSAVSDLAGRVKAHGGCLVLNWHNTHCFGHYRDVYRAILGHVRGAEGLSPAGVPAPNGPVIW